MALNLQYWRSLHNGAFSVDANNDTSDGVPHSSEREKYLEKERRKSRTNPSARRSFPSGDSFTEVQQNVWKESRH
jgi:hypothetical protein